MGPVSSNPTFLDYNLCKEFGWNPQIFEDQIVEIPPFKKILRWIIFGDKLEVTLKRGVDARKIEEFLIIVNETRNEQSEAQSRIERESKLRSGGI